MGKTNGNEPHGRKLYSMMDVLKQAKGLPTTDGYAVLTKDFVDDLCDELRRLYEIEDEAAELRRAGQWVDTAVAVIAELPADLRDKFSPAPAFISPRTRPYPSRMMEERNDE